MATKRLNGEGSIRKKIVKGNVYWEGRYTDADGKQRSVTAKTQSEVRDKLKVKQNQTVKAKEEAEAKAEGHQYYDKNITLNEWQKIYMNLYTKKLKPQTKAMRESIYNNYFRESLGFKKIKNITEDDVSYLKDKMDNMSLASGTIYNNFATLGVLLNKAIEKKIINYNPIKILDLSNKSSSKPKRALTREELNFFFSVVKMKYPYLEPLFIFLQNTGCRIGEAIAIEWCDISKDMTMCSITKTRISYQDIEKHRTVTEDGTPKNKTSKRLVPLNDDVQKMLVELMKQRQSENLYSPTKKVFLSKQKKILRAKCIDQQLSNISKLIQQNYDLNFPDITAHWF
jgi:integrase